MTLMHLLRDRAAGEPGGAEFVFLPDGESQLQPLTARMLDESARAIAARLQSRWPAGTRVLLLYPPGLEFHTAFFGCIYGGMIPVPLPLPGRRSAARVCAVADDAKPGVLLTTSAATDGLQSVLDANPALAKISQIQSDRIETGEASQWRQPDVGPDSIAFVQYTSGSTGAPKGVMVTHANALANCQIFAQALNAKDKTTVVSWLPAFHDMGLVFGILHPLHVGAPCYFMPPVAFAQRPIRWLQLISRVRATDTMSPNFGLDLCVRKIALDACANLDLSCLATLYIGAEPVRYDTLTRFSTAFAGAGFSPRALSPGYGLAECTLGVTRFKHGLGPTHLRVRASLLEKHRVELASDGEADSQTLVSCGLPVEFTEVFIVDPESRLRLGDGQIGEIWVRSSSVAAGYWGRERETAEVFGGRLADCGGPCLRTGDLGFLHDDNLFVTGRIKDLIIIDARNHYPQDIELTVQRGHAAIAPEGCAAFSLDVEDRERLVIVAEINPRALPDADRRANKKDIFRAIANQIRLTVAQEHEVAVFDVVLLKLGRLPKTSSGKVQRQLCRAAYIAKTLDLVEAD